jgi:phosphohistidine phosphatase SixA
MRDVLVLMHARGSTMEYLSRPTRSIWPAVIHCCLASLCLATAATADSFELLAQPGHVLLLRHANAPGTGDPPVMKLSDCSTQRNLDDAGRNQARALGQHLRAAGITNARVYTSELCRCRDTAALLNIGTVQALPALNSTVRLTEAERVSQIKALRDFMQRLPLDGGPVVFVTHQVIVTALSDNFPDSGGGVILQLLPNGGFEPVAEVPAEQ